MVDPLSYFSFQPVHHNWCNKGCGMCHPVCGMMHRKEPLLLTGKSSPCGRSWFPLSQSEWSFTICDPLWQNEVVVARLNNGWESETYIMIILMEIFFPTFSIGLCIKLYFDIIYFIKNQS